MISIEEALEIIVAIAPVLPPVSQEVTEQLLGFILAEDVVADSDSPPFAKSMMDGIAVRSEDRINEFNLMDTILAGDMTGRIVESGRAARIMTGAPIPPGADAVVPVEETIALPDGRVRITGSVPPAGRNILPQGCEFRRGAAILPAGLIVTPAVIGQLAALGRTSVLCHPAPRVAVLSTGNEIVEPGETPGPAQIRNSNGPMLMAQALQTGCVPRYLGLCRDDVGALKRSIEEGLSTADMLIISGGVSMGTHDLIPQTLTACGVQTHFHKVALKPGKPLLFGTRGPTCVFGLPGNPVSSLVGFALFARTALRKMAGHREPRPQPITLPLAGPLKTDNDRPTFLPARTADAKVFPLPWAGSANLLAYREADAMIRVPAGPISLGAGESVTVYRL